MTRLYIILSWQLLVIIGVVVLLGLAPRPFPTGLVHWDAEWYDSIRSYGYYFRPAAKSSVAFFPLFPLLWRASHLGAIGVSLLNLGIAAGSVYLLYKGLQLRPVTVLLFAAFPSSMFLYLPYTEALYFFFSSLLLVLLVRWPHRLGALAVVMFGAALTRVSAFFFLPALTVVEGLGWLRAPQTWLPRLRRLVVYGLATGGGLAAVMLYQWWETGVWFAFNKAEEQWNHHLQWPRLPFISTQENDGALWIDGLALLVGLLALGWVARTTWRVLRHRAPVPDSLLVLAAAYVAAATAQALLEAPIEVGHSSLMSLHRYVFCTPFFIVLLDRLVPRQALPLRPMLLALALVLGTTALLGMLGSKQFNIEWPTSRLPLLWGPVAGSAYAAAVLLYALLWLQSGTRLGRALVFMSSFALQLFFCYTYAVGHWVG